MVTTPKIIWLVNYYAMPPKYESRLRTIKFAHYLTEFGYEVKIFSSSFLHNMNKNLISDKSSYIETKYDDINFVHLKTIGYKRNGIARFLSLLQFHFKLFFLRNKFEKPDIIVHTALPPFGNILYYAARKLKAKYIVEILDLWPESFVDLGVLSKRNPFTLFSYLAEKWLYKKADKIVFSMEGGKNYIIDKKWDKEHGGPIDLNKVFYINNGVDLNDFNINKTLYKLEDADFENKSLKIVTYIGSIRLANNLRELINAAALLKNYSNIKFLLYGDGDDRESLEKYCVENNLTNVIFKQKWIESKYVPYVLSMSSLNILNYKSGSFGKYGGSQSKLFQYLASGKPVCSNLKMMYCPINKYNLGIAKEFSSNEEYADAILSLLNMDKDSSFEMSERMQKVVKEFDYKELALKLERLF
jgi:glycosyltransferase involved in cell wall biosynthesis